MSKQIPIEKFAKQDTCHTNSWLCFSCSFLHIYQAGNATYSVSFTSQEKLTTKPSMSKWNIKQYWKMHYSMSTVYVTKACVCFVRHTTCLHSFKQSTSSFWHIYNSPYNLNGRALGAYVSKKLRYTISL